MIPQDLNIEEFAKNLSGQAAQAFPPDLPEPVKKIVTQVVYEFIKIAGNALSQEERSYNVDETVLICQLVGEWMYHKGIDNFKNQIPQEYWKPILQQIAFAIFEAAKKAVTEGQEQNGVIDAAEVAVNTTYQSMIQQLANENKLSKSVDEIMNQSNLKDYVEQTAEQEITPSQEEKDLKLMTMALFFKSLPPEEVGKMIKMLDADDRRQLGTYMEMPDLEKLVDPVIYNQYLEKFNNFMPKVQKKKQKEAAYSKLNQAFANVNQNRFEQVIENERKNVKNFLMRIYNGKMYEEDILSTDLMNIITDYTVQKISN